MISPCSSGTIERHVDVRSCDIVQDVLDVQSPGTIGCHFDVCSFDIIQDVLDVLLSKVLLDTL